MKNTANSHKSAGSRAVDMMALAGNTDRPAAIRLLRSGLDDPDVDVRDQAAASLGELGDYESLDRLVVVPTHVVDRLRALVLGLGLSTLHPEGGLSCSIVRPS
jgi:hypothetical protein